MDSEKSVYLDREEHVHKGSVGAKTVVPYFYNSDDDILEPGSRPFEQGVQYDYTGFSNPDGNGNYQTISYKEGGAGGTTVRTLSLAYDANSNVTSIAVS
jgi:hypothetical protein